MNCCIECRYCNENLLKTKGISFVCGCFNNSVRIDNYDFVTGTPNQVNCSDYRAKLIDSFNCEFFMANSL